MPPSSLFVVAGLQTRSSSAFLLLLAFGANLYPSSVVLLAGAGSCAILHRQPSYAPASSGSEQYR